MQYAQAYKKENYSLFLKWLWDFKTNYEGSETNNRDPFRNRDR